MPPLFLIVAELDHGGRSDGRAETAAAIRIFVDADACPVKPEIYRVAERYGLKVFVVANSS